MGVVINAESDLGREMAKWDKPYVFVRFPQMLYKAFQRENGKVMCGDNPMAHRDASAALEAEAFSRQCQLIVRNESEYERAVSDGWRDTIPLALEHYDNIQKEIAQAAAEANFAVKRMSEKARDEKAAADQDTHEHVVDVVPVKRGRPRAVTGAEA